MKIAHLIGQYLLQNKKMQLQGLGEFTMENFYDNPFEHEKGKIKLPDNAIRFTPDKKCKEDQGLIEFISKSTGKIKPLAFSDLEDFLNIGKQLLNVSKQFYIEGLGTMVLDAHENLSFSQGGELMPAAISEDSSKKQREAKEDMAGISFSDNYNTGTGTNATRKILVTLAIVAALALVGWIAYYFYAQWQENKNETTAVPQDIQPVLSPSTPSTDSTAQKAVTDTTAAATVQSAKVDSAAGSLYHVIIETSKRTRALKRYQDLLDMGYKVSMSTEDSVTFKIFTNINGPLTDTTRVRDSIARFFGRKVIVELKK